MSNISFKGDEKMRKFIDFLREHGINKYIALPGKPITPLSLRPISTDVTSFFSQRLL